MKPTRRSFLAGAGTLLAAAAATPLQAIVPKTKPPVDPPAPQSHDSWLSTRPQSEYVSQFQWNETTFQQFVNTNFTVADGRGGKMILRLLSVQDTRKQNAKSTTAFSLVFQLISGKGFPQGAYEFSNPQLGKFLLFIVGNKSHGAPYVAIINRL